MNEKNPAALNIYIDKAKKLTIVPYYYHEAGFGIDIGDYTELKTPYTLEDVGRTIIKCLQESSQKPIINSQIANQSTPSFQKLTNGKGFLYWLRHHECILLYLTAETIKLEYCHREERGDNRGYSKHLDEYNETELFLPLSATPIQIAEAIDRIYYTKNIVHLC